MKKILLAIIAMVLIAFFACSSDDNSPEQVVIEDVPEDGAITSMYYIQCYIKASKIVGYSCSGYASIGCGGEKYYSEEINSQFDRSYNNDIVPYSTCSVLNVFRKIDLVSDSDFDEQHKAGASLADIVRFAGASPYDFIARGYKNPYAWGKTDPDFYKNHKIYYEYGYDPVYERLSEIDPKKFELIDPLFYIEFEKLPSQSKTHNLTLTVTDDKGKTLTATWQQTFGE